MKKILIILLLISSILYVNANLDISSLIIDSNKAIETKKNIRNVYKKNYISKQNQYEIEVWYNRCLNIKKDIQITDCDKTRKNLEKYAKYNTIKTAPVNSKIVYNKNWARDDKRQKWLNYMYRKSNYNKNLMWTFLAENGTMWLTKKSWIVWANWYSDYWICQINSGYHKIILWKWNWKYFADWFYNPYKQMDYCIKLYNQGTRFYGYNVRYKSKNKLIFK